MNNQTRETVTIAKVILGIASTLSAAIGGFIFYAQNLPIPAGIAIGFFGYALLGIATLKLNQTIRAWAFGPNDDPQGSRAMFIAIWPVSTVISCTICPIVILVNAVI